MEAVSNPGVQETLPVYKLLYIFLKWLVKSECF